MTVAAVALACALLALDLTILIRLEVRRLRATERAWLEVGPVRRSMRGVRAMSLRWVLWWLSWPHVVDRMLGAGRVAIGSSPAVEVWSAPGTHLVRYVGARHRRRPVLIVHSLVTRPWILDLLPGRSVVAALVADGFDVFLLDWGETDSLSRSAGLADRIAAVHQACAEILARTGASALHVVGYCTGGTVAIAAAAAYPGLAIASLTLLAAPVDTRSRRGMARMLRRRSLTPVLALDGRGCVPASVLRESFHSLRRDALRSAWRRLRTPRRAPAREVNAALSRWAWEQRALPGPLFFDLVDLYRSNSLLRGTLEYAGHSLSLADVRPPVLVAVADRDHIVEPASSLALAGVAGIDAETIRCPSGHVSMLVGHEAQTLLYPALVDWLVRHDVSA